MSGIFGRRVKQVPKPPTDEEWKQIIGDLLETLAHRHIKNVTMMQMDRAVGQAFLTGATWDETCEGEKEELRNNKCWPLAFKGPQNEPEPDETRKYAYAIIDALARLQLVTFRLTRLPRSAVNPWPEYRISNFKVTPTSLSVIVIECSCGYQQLFSGLYKLRQTSRKRREELLRQAYEPELEMLDHALKLSARGVEFEGDLSAKFLSQNIRYLKKKSETV